MATTKIFKYKLNGIGNPTKITCRRSRILDIQMQEGDMVCWIETRDDYPETTTEIVSIGTGWEIPSDVMTFTNYLKTIQDHYGYVWHFYEVLSGH